MAGEVNLRATLARPFLAITGSPQVAYLLVGLGVSFHFLFLTLGLPFNPDHSLTALPRTG